MTDQQDKNKTHENKNDTDSPLERVANEDTPVGDVLDKASPEFPAEEETVSWSPDAKPADAKPDRDDTTSN